MRSRSITGAFTLFAVSALAQAGCAHRRPSVDTYFPLAVGNEWTYDVVVGAAGTRSETFRITSQKPGDRGETRYELDGVENRYYVRAPELVALAVSVGIWTVMLRGPLDLGRRFSGGLTSNEGFHVIGETEDAILAQRVDQEMLPIPQSGYKVVTSLSREVTVPAGIFHDCLEISHVAGTVVGVKYFAPRVGLVMSEAWVERDGKRSMLSRQVLTRYHLSTASQESR